MKILATLVLGLAGLMIVLGGLGSVAEQTYPQVFPVELLYPPARRQAIQRC